jgi:hypothetical protein
MMSHRPKLMAMAPAKVSAVPPCANGSCSTQVIIMSVCTEKPDRPAKSLNGA